MLEAVPWRYTQKYTHHPRTAVSTDVHFRGTRLVYEGVRAICGSSPQASTIPRTEGAETAHPPTPIFAPFAICRPSPAASVSALREL